MADAENAVVLHISRHIVTSKKTLPDRDAVLMFLGWCWAQKNAGQDEKVMREFVRKHYARYYLFDNSVSDRILNLFKQPAPGAVFGSKAQMGIWQRVYAVLKESVQGLVPPSRLPALTTHAALAQCLDASLAVHWCARLVWENSPAYWPLVWSSMKWSRLGHVLEAAADQALKSPLTTEHYGSILTAIYTAKDVSS